MLDFEALNSLLDDDRSYMNVSKEMFLNALKNEIDKEEGLVAYDTVVVGICNSCNKGCAAYKFKADNQLSLNLFFEEEDGDITDIYLCHDLKVGEAESDEFDIYFYFHEEDKVDFTYPVEYLIKLQKIEKAIADFNGLAAKGLVDVEEVVYWYDKQKALAKSLDLDIPFSAYRYKGYLKIASLYAKVSQLAHNYKNINLAKEAMSKYKKIDKKDERNIVKWLLEYEDNYFFPLKKTDNWEKTGIIILETEINLAVDYSGYFDTLDFDAVFDAHYYTITNKYKPIGFKPAEDEKGGIEYNLKTFLKLHNKYKDLF